MRLPLETVKKATSLYRQGVAFEDIARECNVSVETVIRLITGIKVITQRRPRQQEDAKLIAAINNEESVEEISENQKKDVAEVAAVARHAQKTGRVEEVNTTTLNEDTNYRHLIEIASKFQAALRETDPIMREVSLRIDSDTPITIICMSDWHLGSQWTDMGKILEVVDYIKSTPNVYCFFGGDIFDAVGNGSKHTSILHEQLIQPSVVRKIAKGLFQDLGPKLLAFTAGCHDTWMQDAVDLDEVAEMSSSPYLGHGGAVNISVGSQVYRIGLRHKFSGSTSQSIFNSCKAYLHKVDATADIVIIGHHHVSGVAAEVWQGKERLFVRTGAAKAIDRYAAQLGLAPVRSTELDNGFPAIVIWPNKKRMMGFGDWTLARDLTAKKVTQECTI